MKKIKNYINNNRFQLLICLCSSIIIFLIANSYGLLNNIFSHDSLNALYADSAEEAWKIALGRFVVPVIRTVSRGSVAIPWLIGIVAVIYISISAFIILKLFNVQSPFISAIICGILVTNVTVTSSIATYVYEFDIDMLATLFAVISVYIWQKYDKLIYSLPSIVLIILSLGIYQSNICVAAVLMVCVLIFRLLDGNSFKEVFKKAVAGVAELGIGCVVYYLLSKAAIAIFNVEAAARTDALGVSDSLTTDVSVINSINAMIYYELKKIFNPVSVYPSAVVGALNGLLIVIAGLIVLSVILKLGKGKTPEKLLAVALVATLPFAAGFICILTKGEIHDIMIYAFWIILVFIISVISKYSANISKDKLKLAVKAVSVICSAVIIWNNILVANTAYLKKDLEQEATISTLTRVVEDLEERDDYIAGETEICFRGANFVEGVMPGFESVTEITGLEYNTSIGLSSNSWYYCSYEKYFRYFLNYPVNITKKDFDNNPIIKAMPSFPEEGYIKNIDGVLVIRMQ